MRTALKVAVVLSGRTHAEIAYATGLTEWQVSRIVNGHLVPPPEVRARIARTLGVPLERIFREDWTTAKLSGHE